MGLPSPHCAHSLSKFWLKMSCNTFQCGQNWSSFDFYLFTFCSYKFGSLIFNIETKRQHSSGASVLKDLTNLQPKICPSFQYHLITNCLGFWLLEHFSGNFYLMKRNALCPSLIIERFLQTQTVTHNHDHHPSKYQAENWWIKGETCSMLNNNNCCSRRGSTAKDPKIAPFGFQSQKRKFLVAVSAKRRKKRFKITAPSYWGHPDTQPSEEEYGCF